MDSTSNPIFAFRGINGVSPGITTGVNGDNIDIVNEHTFNNVGSGADVLINTADPNFTFRGINGISPGISAVVNVDNIDITNEHDFVNLPAALGAFPIMNDTADPTFGFVQLRPHPSGTVVLSTADGGNSIQFDASPTLSTYSNVGGATGQVFVPGSGGLGATADFKTLNPGPGISINNGAVVIDINNTHTFTNFAVAGVPVLDVAANPNFRFRPINALGSGISVTNGVDPNRIDVANLHTFANTAPGIGGTLPLLNAGGNPNFLVRQLVAGPNVTLTSVDGGSSVQIASAGAAPPSTYQNLDVVNPQIYVTGSSAPAQFRSVAVLDHLNITQNATNVAIGSTLPHLDPNYIAAHLFILSETITNPIPISGDVYNGNVGFDPPGLFYYDTQNMYNAGTRRFVIPASGYYRINALMSMNDFGGDQTGGNGGYGVTSQAYFDLYEFTTNTLLASAGDFIRGNATFNKQISLTPFLSAGHEIYITYQLTIRSTYTGSVNIGPGYFSIERAR